MDDWIEYGAAGFEKRTIEMETQCPKDFIITPYDVILSPEKKVQPNESETQKVFRQISEYTWQSAFLAKVQVNSPLTFLKSKLSL